MSPQAERDIAVAVAALITARGPQARRKAAAAVNQACFRAHASVRECVGVFKRALPSDMPLPAKGVVCGWVMGAECANAEFGARAMLGEALMMALDYLAGRAPQMGATEPTCGEDLGVAEQRATAALHAAVVALGEARARDLVTTELADLLTLFEATVVSATMRKGTGEK